MEIKMKFATPMQQSAMMILSRKVMVLEVVMRMRRMRGMLVTNTSAVAAVTSTVLVSAPGCSWSSTEVMVMGRQSGLQTDRFMALDSTW